MYVFSFRCISIGKSYAAASEGRGLEQLVNLNKMFRTKPISLALPPGSPQRVNEPNYKGIHLLILKRPSRGRKKSEASGL
ncbi:hypothetical protein QVD17_38660 [Tagetes erecta]|uniref:Uncharacterized protein n=1 Tax=Tagetes erecta TaxID=13708 RepID=A0AAD8JSI8_TARER|nr:hypothetical protein QVD17_38660 [Tagetes erecta]